MHSISNCMHDISIFCIRPIFRPSPSQPLSNKTKYHTPTQSSPGDYRMRMMQKEKRTPYRKEKRKTPHDKNNRKWSRQRRKKQEIKTKKTECLAPMRTHSLLRVNAIDRPRQTKRLSNFSSSPSLERVINSFHSIFPSHPVENPRPSVCFTNPPNQQESAIHATPPYNRNKSNNISRAIVPPPSPN